MKTTYLSLILVMSFTVALGQTKPQSNSIPAVNTLKKTNLYSLQKFGKLAWQDKFSTEQINLSPKNFNWYTDMKRIESIKIMALNIRQQDFCGRDLPIDIHTQLIQSVYSRNLFDQ